jgi:hypothetical protein
MNIYVIVSAVAMGLLQHVVHEYAHILMARTQGVQVVRVHWFTYAGGTRVFYQGEPSVDQDQIDTKWGRIALGGLIGTTLTGYLLISIFLCGLYYQSAWSLVILFFGSVIFLMTDPFYFLIGALFEFGDVVGVMKAFRLRKSVVIVISLLLLMLAHLTIMQVWYGSASQGYF